MALIVFAGSDPAVRGTLACALGHWGHLVREVGSTREILREVAEADVDMVILDANLPDATGDIALRVVRRVSSVLMIAITPTSDERGIVTALRAGADHCMPKPVSAGRLCAHVGALLRRGQAASSPNKSVIVIGDLTIDLRTRTATFGRIALELNRREFDLLSYLATHAGTVVTRQQLFKHVWQRVGADSQTIDVHICWLRRKLGETAQDPRYVRTVRGVGFVMPAQP